MNGAFILNFMRMPRRTIHISEATEELVRELATEGESFSAAATRLIEAGAATVKGKRPPDYVGAGTGAPDELGRHAEEYLRQHFSGE